MRILLCLLLLLGCCTLRAQDLILTTSGDSIHCVITSVAPNRLFYTVKDGEDDQRKDIPLDQVALYKRAGYFPVILGDVKEGSATGSVDGDRKWMMSFAGGWSHRTAQAPDGLDATLTEYIEVQRNGIHASGSLHYFINEELAIGAVYSSFFGAKNSMEITALLEDSTTVTGIMADDVRLRWAALNILFVPIAPGRWSFSGSLGIGPLFYKDHATLINNFTISGTTVALGGSLGLDYQVTDAVSIGGQFAYMIGSLDRLEIDFGSSKATVSLPDKYNESVNRIDLGLVLRVRL